MTTIVSRQMPEVRPVAIQDLRLGDCLITPLPNGNWAESIVYFLGQDFEYTHQARQWHFTYGLAPRRVALDRIFNHQKYALVPPPLPQFMIDLTESERLAMQPNPQGHVHSAISIKPKWQPSPLLRATDRSKLLLNGIDKRTANFHNLDLQAIRHAAQTLRPDQHVAVCGGRNNIASTVKAVGFGLRGPLGILVFAPPADCSEAALQRQGRWQILPADLWIDTRHVSVSVTDPQRDNVSLKNFHLMKRVQIPHA